MVDPVKIEALAESLRGFGKSMYAIVVAVQPVLRRFSQQIDKLGLRYIDAPRFAEINLARKDKRGKNAIKGKARKRLKLLRSQFRRGII